MKLKPSSWILIAAFLLFLTFSGLWIINDAFALAVNFGNGYVGNGFVWLNMVQAFHIGLWMVGIPLWVLFLIAIHKIMREDD